MHELWMKANNYSLVHKHFAVWKNSTRWSSHSRARTQILTDESPTRSWNAWSWRRTGRWGQGSCCCNTRLKLQTSLSCWSGVRPSQKHVWRKSESRYQTILFLSVNVIYDIRWSGIEKWLKNEWFGTASHSLIVLLVWALGEEIIGMKKNSRIICVTNSLRGGLSKFALSVLYQI